MTTSTSERWERDREAREAITEAMAAIREAGAAIERAAGATRRAIGKGIEVGPSEFGMSAGTACDADAKLADRVARAVEAMRALEEGLAAWASAYGRFSAVDATEGGAR